MVSFAIRQALLVLTTAASLATANSVVHTIRQTTNSTPPVRFGMILFPSFTPLDVFGPLDMLNFLSLSKPLELSLIAKTLDPVSTRVLNPKFQQANSNFSQSVLPTHTFADPPSDLDVLFVPGGAGTRAVNSTDSSLRLDDLVAYVRATYPSLQYVVSVCTGAQLLAAAGVLDGRTATTNKQAFRDMAPWGPRTYWRAHARWVVDGNVYTSAGVTAGIDATLQFIEDVWGNATATRSATVIEHVRHLTPDDDPFSKALGLVDIPPVV